MAIPCCALHFIRGLWTLWGWRLTGGTRKDIILRSNRVSQAGLHSRPLSPHTHPTPRVTSRSPSTSVLASVTQMLCSALQCELASVFSFSWGRKEASLVILHEELTELNNCYYFIRTNGKHNCSIKWKFHEARV